MPTPSKRPWAPPSWSVLILVSALVVLLNAFDALATIEIVRRGGEEANPVARPMFERGHAAFLVWKMGLSTACTVILAIISRLHRAAWYLFWVAVGAYACIAALHVYLLWFIARPS